MSVMRDAPAPAAVVDRILRKLMLRGLTRKVAGEWVPAPPLLQPAQLRRIGDLHSDSSGFDDLTNVGT
jgi:hypothetical protein